ALVERLLEHASRREGEMYVGDAQGVNPREVLPHILPSRDGAPVSVAPAGYSLQMEAQRAQRFIDGLYPAVRHNIVGHGTQTYARAVSIAPEVDASIRREAVRDQFQPFAPAQSSSVPPMPALPSAQPPKNNKRKGKGAPTDKRTRRRLQKIPQCPTCGRLHRGECRFSQDVCYYCHEPGHFTNRCPKKAQQPQQPPQQQQP
ncbi:Unknown protein, partial [Striga hermonthica]